MAHHGLERLFDKLVKQKMGGAALPIAGVLAGLCVVTEGPRLSPAPFDWWVGAIGIAIMAASGVVFVAATIVYAIMWARDI
jgi:hypothetical protein